MVFIVSITRRKSSVQNQSVVACTGGRGPVYAFIYPNFMINRYGNSMDTNMVVPTGVSSCRVTFEWYTHVSQVSDCHPLCCLRVVKSMPGNHLNSSARNSKLPRKVTSQDFMNGKAVGKPHSTHARVFSHDINDGSGNGILLYELCETCCSINDGFGIGSLPCELCDLLLL